MCFRLVKSWHLVWSRPQCLAPTGGGGLDSLDRLNNTFPAIGSLLRVFPVPDPDLALRLLTEDEEPQPLFVEASRLRDEGKGRTITYSPKVFIPLTTLCRDSCGYCTFAKPPGAGGEYIEPDDVLAIAKAGESAGCTEALFTLGDQPELRWPAARSFLAAHGCGTTIDYLVAMSEVVARDTALFPHANPGVMDDQAVNRLRPFNLSMGLMLENSSPRLTQPGMPHFDCHDKLPEVRIATMEAAARAQVPFTTGILVGIGETPAEMVESLFVLADLARRLGNLQEVICQNFRAKADTRMRKRGEPSPQYFARVVAVARWILGPQMNLQVPPNLSERYEVLLAAGINDWGGVSPLTIDWVNPERPWPHLSELRARTQAAGFQLQARLPTYPEFLSEQWVSPALLEKARRATDTAGYPVTSPG